MSINHTQSEHAPMWSMSFADSPFSEYGMPQKVFLKYLLIMHYLTFCVSTFYLSLFVVLFVCTNFYICLL